MKQSIIKGIAVAVSVISTVIGCGNKLPDGITKEWYDTGMKLYSTMCSYRDGDITAERYKFEMTVLFEESPELPRTVEHGTVVVKTILFNEYLESTDYVNMEEDGELVEAWNSYNIDTQDDISMLEDVLNIDI